jgi:hypothetical protein
LANKPSWLSALGCYLQLRRHSLVREADFSATGGDYEGTLADKVTVKAVVEGVVLETERTVLVILRNPV